MLEVLVAALTAACCVLAGCLWHLLQRPPLVVFEGWEAARSDAIRATAKDAEIARLKADLLYAESLIRRLLAKYEPDDSTDHGTQERCGNGRIH